MRGGSEGSPNYMKIIRRDGSEEVYGMVARVPLEKGDVARLVTGTGGGFGDPSDRPQRKVEEDIKNGFITRDQAIEHYHLDAKDGSAD